MYVCTCTCYIVHVCMYVCTSTVHMHILYVCFLIALSYHNTANQCAGFGISSGDGIHERVLAVPCPKVILRRADTAQRIAKQDDIIRQSPLKGLLPQFQLKAFVSH